MTPHDLKQFEQLLDKKLNGLTTKEDLKRFASKDDLEKFATKDDLENFVTRDDLKQFEIKLDNKLEKLSGELQNKMGELGVEIKKFIEGGSASKKEHEDLERRVEILENEFQSV